MTCSSSATRSTDIYGGKLNAEGYKSVAKQLADKFHFENSHVMPAMMRKVYLSKLIHDGAWDSIARDMDRRPVEGVSGSSSREEILAVLSRYGIEDNRVTLCL